MKLIVIGSDSRAHIKLNSRFVSGYHAELLLIDNGEILLTDKGSKNGTFLNDQRLQPNKEVPIKRGDVVRFADQPLDWRNVPIIEMPDLKKIKEMRGIGTNFRNKYQLQGEKVSRFHATMTRRSDDKWYIQDHSKNGTTINGNPIPSNQDVKLKRGDRIMCAGVPVANPYGEGPVFDFRQILVILSIVLLCGGGVWGAVKLLDDKKDVGNTTGNTISGKKLNDEDIYERYKNSTILLIGFYHYRVTAGNLDLKNVLGWPTDVVLSDGELKAVTERSDMNLYTGTGFYVSDDGKIATNLHISRPWLFNTEASEISDYYKMKLSRFALTVPELNAYVSQVKVEGVLSYIGMLPNGAYFSSENLKECRELVGHDNPNKDVAILQLETKRLPESSSVIDIDKAVLNDSDIKVGSHIYTMGFPFGLTIQDLQSSKGIRILANGGSITQECTEYSFGFNAPSYGGASGSPIFNEYGQLVGILNSGVSKTQGFNYAIKAAYVKELLEQSRLK